MNKQTNKTNLDFIHKLAKGDEARMEKYISLYLKSMGPVLDDLQKEYDNGNWENIRLKAHSVKPQAQYMGVSELGQILVDIEMAVRDGSNTQQIQTLIHTAKKINAKAEAELRAFLLS